MTQTEQLADIIALSVHAATEPLLLILAVLEAKLAAVEGRPVVSMDTLSTLVDTAADLRTRLISVEARALIPGPPGPPGARGEMGNRGLDGEDGKDGANGIAGKDGAIGPAGKDGASGLNGKDGRDGIDGKDGSAGLHGKDGRDGLAGKDGVNGLAGKSLTLDDVAPVIAASVTNAFEAMPKPKDGLGVKSAVITNDGRLLLTWSDETVKDLGVVMGKAGRDGLPAIGRPGTDGTSVTLADVRPLIQTELTKAVAAIPKTRDGIDGKDGLGFDDFDLAFDELKGWFMVFSRGSERKSFHVPIPWDAGVWQVGRLYPKGAGTTVKGAFFIAQVATKTRPDDGTPESARAWRLAVKGGRDGKPGKDGRDGTEG